MNKGIRFTDEFKRDAVAQVVERGYAVSEVAERLVINTKSLYTWKAQFLKPPHVRAEVLDQAAEIRRLKRELARVTEERSILKKGVAFVRHWSEDNGRARTSRESLPSHACKHALPGSGSRVRVYQHRVAIVPWQT